jgi:hypothetical protein
VGVKIIFKCDLCPAEDETFLWGEDPKPHGWEVNRNYCLCPDCNNPQFDDHEQVKKQAHIEAVRRLAA